MIPTTFDHFHRVSTVPAVCYPLLVMNPWARALVITLQWILTSKTPPDQDFDCKTSSGFKGRLLMVVNYPRGKHKQVQKSPLGIESTIKLIKGPVRTLWRFPNFWNVTDSTFQLAFVDEDQHLIIQESCFKPPMTPRYVAQKHSFIYAFMNKLCDFLEIFQNFKTCMAQNCLFLCV